MDIKIETVDKGGFGLFVRLGPHPLVVNTRDNGIFELPVYVQTDPGMYANCVGVGRGLQLRLAESLQRFPIGPNCHKSRPNP